MRRKISLLILIAVTVGLTSSLAISRGWDRKKIGKVELKGENPGIYSVLSSFTIHLSQERSNPENKAVKIYGTIHKIKWFKTEEIEYEISMDLDDWEDWIEDINRIDQRLHEYAEKGIIEE